MINRSGDVGFAQFDSTQCAGGQEITTYDSLDHSLAQTRNNVYIAVKSWASYRALALLFRDLGANGQSETVGRFGRQGGRSCRRPGRRRRAAGNLRKGKPGIQLAHSAGGRRLRVSALLRKNRMGRLHTLEQVFASPSEKRMYDVLKEHTRNLLLDPERRNLFADGGIKLSSTSNNSWMSKISIFMHVTRKVFHLDQDPAVARGLSRGRCRSRQVADRRQLLLGLLRPDRVGRRQGQPLLSAHHYQRALDGLGPPSSDRTTGHSLFARECPCIFSA